MKLTYENSRGETIVITNTSITETEVELDVSLALDPMWENLKTKIEVLQENKNA